jgi:ATP-dependent Clp protease adaptor protein ClpS
MTATDVDTEVRIKLKTPTLYKVVILNDDFTPMDFVIEVLVQIFNKNEAEAYELTMQVHKEGRGLCGVFTKEIADTKVLETMSVAKRYGHPLKAVAEPA